MLINTGLAASAELIKASIQAIGCKYEDIRLLLTSQAHFDHVGAMAQVQRETGAECWVNGPDAEVMRDGGRSDYFFGGDTASFVPVRVDSVLRDGAVIRQGNIRLTMLSHPGHTKGSCSYLFDAVDGARTYRVLIANMPSVIIEEPFSTVTSYPDMVRDYQRTFASLDTVRFDFWVAAHASQFGLSGLRNPGDPYKPMVFSHKKMFRERVGRLRTAFEEKVRRERGGE